MRTRTVKKPATKGDHIMKLNPTAVFVASTRAKPTASTTVSSRALTNVHAVATADRRETARPSRALTAPTANPPSGSAHSWVGFNAVFSMNIVARSPTVAPHNPPDARTTHTLAIRVRESTTFELMAQRYRRRTDRWDRRDPRGATKLQLRTTSLIDIQRQI